MKAHKTHFNSLILTMCLIFISLVSFLDFAKSDYAELQYIQSKSDYEVHTEHHIKNVSRLGMKLYEMYKDTLFHDVSEDLLRKKLQLHDYEKFASIEELRRIGYRNKRTFTDRLYDVLGKNKSDPKYSLEINALIRELSVIEEYYNQRFLRQHNLINYDGTLTSAAQKMIMIEKISDVVERSMSPGSPEELGMRKVDEAARYLKSAKEHVLAEQLAKIYHEVTPLHPLISRAKRRTGSPSCSNLFR